MNRAELRTELQATGFGNSTAEVIRQNHWLDAAYQWVWNARDPQGAPIKWGFAQVDQATLTITAGQQPTMPADFDDAMWVDDAQGQEIDELEPQKFDRLFASAVAAGQTGTPIAYKVVNRQIVFGPVPGADTTMTMTYRRRLTHGDAAGNPVAGPMGTDTDQPLWPDHHMILVYHAVLVGGAMSYNPFAVAAQGLRDDALQAMRNDLEAEFAPAQVWGGGNWHRVGW